MPRRRHQGDLDWRSVSSENGAFERLGRNPARLKTNKCRGKVVRPASKGLVRASRPSRPFHEHPIQIARVSISIGHRPRNMRSNSGQMASSRSYGSGASLQALGALGTGTDKARGRTDSASHKCRDPDHHQGVRHPGCASWRRDKVLRRPFPDSAWKIVAADGKEEGVGVGT